MTRSQKPGSNAASARDRVPAGFFHAPRFEAAARRDTMCRENARSSKERSTRGGRHGLPKRLRRARGSACRRRREHDTGRSPALSTSAQERQGRSRSRQAEEQILCASAVLQRTRRTAAWQARNRAQRASFGRRRKKRQDERFPRQGCGIPGGRGKLWTPQQLLRPRIRGAATTLSATHRTTRLPRTFPPQYEAGAGTMWGGPASGFRAFSQEDVCALPRKIRGIPKLRGSRDAPPGRYRKQATRTDPG